MSEIRIESSRGLTRQPVRMLGLSLPREGIDASRYTKQVLLDPNFDPEGSLLGHLCLEDTEDGEPLWSTGGYWGYCLAVARKVPLENAPPDDDRGYITLLGVAPKARGRGIGSVLLDRAETFLRERERKVSLISPYAPGYFCPGVDVEAYADGLRFLKNRGYEEAYRPLAMERSLWDYERPHWLDEFDKNHRRRVSYQSPRSPGLFAHDLLAFVADAFPGDWVRVVRETLGDILSGDRPDRLIIATDLEADRVIGFSHYRAERFGPIGVHPEYRGRGIGHMLTHMTLVAQQKAGYRSSWFMWTDDRTADRIYKPAGFREVRRFAVLKKEL